MVFSIFAGLSPRWVVRSAIRGELQIQAGKAAATAVAATPVSAPAALVKGQGMRAPAVTQVAAPIQEEAPAEMAWAAELPPQDLPPESGTTALPITTPSALPTAATSATPRPAAEPRLPALSNPVELALLAAQNWFMGGNTIVHVGLVILFIGLSFVARYAALAGLFPVEFRLTAIAAAAIALMVVGFRKCAEKSAFVLALQGGSVAVMYLTVFAAFRLYDLLPPLPAFGLMIAVCTLSCALALLQNSRSLAVAAFAGGFAGPVLLSTGQGSHVGLFSCHTLLNLAILFIAYKRSWRVLNVVGFIATFDVTTA